MQGIVVGTDVPDLCREVLHQAECLLDAFDVVYGPVPDGGYYLVGVKAAHRCLFEGIAWSTGKVLQQSVEHAQQAGLSVAPMEAMPTLVDIDHRQVRQCPLLRCLVRQRTLCCPMYRTTADGLHVAT